MVSVYGSLCILDRLPEFQMFSWNLKGGWSWRCCLRCRWGSAGLPPADVSCIIFGRSAHFFIWRFFSHGQMQFVTTKSRPHWIPGGLSRRKVHPACWFFTESLTSLPLEGFGRERKLPPLKFCTVGIVQKTRHPNTTAPTNIITMVVPFAPTTAWYLWIFLIRRG